VQCISNSPYEVRVKRRILLVDDDLAVLLTLKAVLELHGFEVDTAASSAEAFARLESGVYQMVISDLRMETEEAGLEVLRAARRQAYDPATALLTAYPPSGEHWRGERGREEPGRGEGYQEESRSEDQTAESADSLLIKPLGTGDLLRQVEALLIRHADLKQQRERNSALNAQEARHRAG
jgi:DNA-binding response OmpR family regulator